MLLLSTALVLFALAAAEIREFEGILPEDEINDESERIIGGQQAKQGQFPFAAALYMDEEFICTASIISPTDILTAAHCVVFPLKFPDSQKNPPNWVGFKNCESYGGGQAQKENRSSTPEILKYVQQRVVSNLKCRILYLGRRVPESSLCASGLLSGVCYGDSGGPLVYEMGRKGQKVQVGIASYVNSLVGCGSILGPAGFTRVSSFTSFIMNTATGKVCVV
ncbi:Serine protease 3 like protein [Argiope bruennichi]|uniref:Serine protease 3 like protein n=1 Tax=Argiope bruennichi TaxID=94029 RepID=A0A8T0E081_ARGBR|nr:Serine protease 3 like protein [Argiope bruennichi]